MSTLASLGVQLQRASRTTGTGNTWLTTCAVFAFTVSTWMAMTVAGGTWMFYQRAKHPWTDSLKDIDEGYRQIYVGLAVVACVFVVPAMMSLVAQSAVLGASGRDRRLATLRLLGLSNGDITRVTLVETGAQAITGLVIGTVLYVALVPAWSLVSFENTPIGTWEVLLPWWAYPALWALIIALAALAAVIGLKRVMVSPLGVSKRQMPKALKFWRVLLFIAIILTGRALATSINVNPQNLGGAMVIMAMILFAMILAINIVAPFLIQCAAWASRAFPGNHHFLATRRVMTDGRTAWKRVSALTFLALLLGYVGTIPRDPVGDIGNQTISTDTFTGAVITYCVGLIISASGTLLNQASAVFDERELTRALDFIGVPSSLHNKVAMTQTLYPLLMTSGLSFLFGLYMGKLSYGRVTSDHSGTHIGWTVIAFLLSLALSVGATVLVDPRRHKQLGTRVRRND